MSVLELLRKETGYYHNLLNSHPKLSKITSDSVTEEDYHQYLVLFYGIHSIVEREIEKFIDSSFPFDARLNLLVDDIAHCSLEPYTIKSQSFTLDKNRVLGAYYVLEGSKLGGKFIAGHLTKHLSTNDNQFSFLLKKSNYSWKNVLDKLTEIDPTLHDETVEGAVQTFKFILSYVHQFYELENK